ncbi:MAG: hypothetical protein DIU52_000995 [bacterium]|jgi:hypothetical protein
MTLPRRAPAAAVVLLLATASPRSGQRLLEWPVRTEPGAVAHRTSAESRCGAVPALSAGLDFEPDPDFGAAVRVFAASVRLGRSPLGVLREGVANGSGGAYDHRSHVVS